MEDKWGYKAVSVTKYNPIYRDDSGAYTKDEWTEFTDIGKNFEGETLTKELYEAVESKYLHAITLFLLYTGCSYVFLEDVYVITDYGDFFDRNDIDLIPFYTQVIKAKEDSVSLKIAVKDVLPFAKLILRTYIQGTLHGDENYSYVRFGFDYYMYFNSTKPLKPIYQDIKGIGLFMD